MVRMMVVASIVVGCAGGAGREGAKVDPLTYQVPDCTESTLAATDRDDFWSVSQAHPRFAGRFLEGTNEIVLLTDLTPGSGLEREFPSAQFRRAEFSWRQLVEAKCRLTNVLSDAEAVSLDADERYNRVTLAMATEAGRARAQAVAERVVAPARLVLTSVEPAISSLSSPPR